MIADAIEVSRYKYFEYNNIHYSLAYVLKIVVISLLPIHGKVLTSKEGLADLTRQTDPRILLYNLYQMQVGFNLNE